MLVLEYTLGNRRSENTESLSSGGFPVARGGETHVRGMS